MLQLDPATCACSCTGDASERMFVSASSSSLLYPCLHAAPTSPRVSSLQCKRQSGNACVPVQLLRTLRHVLTMHSWWHLPRFAYGSSRGGAMTLILALRFPLQVQIALPRTFLYLSRG